jgi:predicted nucleic acid-binding protein
MSQTIARVYIDANIFIYIVDGTPDYKLSAKHAIASFEGAAHFFSSQMSLGECLRGALRRGNSGSVADYSNLLETGGIVALEPVTLPLIKRAAALGAELNMKLVDAIHVATAEALGCEVFLTNDRGIRAPDGIELRYLSAEA